MTKSPVPPWRWWLAVGIVIGLATALVLISVGRDRDPPVGDAAPGTTGTTRPRASDLPSTTAPAGAASSPTDEAFQAPVDAARDALDAWGRFAVSGDLAELDGTFHPEGPQRQALAIEAAALSEAPLGAPPYAVTLIDPSPGDPAGGEVTVEAGVRFARPGEEDQVYRWRITLRAASGRWLLWSVEDAGG